MECMSPVALFEIYAKRRCLRRRHLRCSYLELHRRRFARLPETRGLFMYSKLTEYMNNYVAGCARRARSDEEDGMRGRGRRGAHEEREREGRRACGGGLDLIDKVDLSAWHDLSATRGRAFTFFFSLGFSIRVFPAAVHSFPRRPGIIRDETLRRVHHVLSFTCFTTSLAFSRTLTSS